MDARPSPTRGAPCPKFRASPRSKPKDQLDIKVSSHRQTVQHSVRSQKLDERQLSKFFKSLDDLRIKRLLQIDKEMAEQEQVLEKLAYEKEVARKERLARRGNNSRNADSDLSAVMPDHLKRGPRPSVQRRSSNFDLFAFMMRRESDQSVAAYDKDKKTIKKPARKSRKQSKRFPPSAPKLDDHRVPANSAVDDRIGEGLRPTTPGMSPSPASIASLAKSVSLDSLPPSTSVMESNDSDVAPAPKRRFPSGSDWTVEVGANDVNRGDSARARQRTTRSKQPRIKTSPPASKSPTQDNKTAVKVQPKANTSQVKVTKHTSKLGVGVQNSQARRGPPVEKLRKEVSFHFDDEKDGIGTAGTMQDNNLLTVSSSPSASSDSRAECKEPDCIFHNKAYREASVSNDYTIDDYYRAVSGKPTVSPLFMPAGSPRSWSRRGVVRPTSPTLSDFLRQFDDKEPNGETSKGNLSESDSFLSVRRPLKGSNREKMLKDKEENVRTTFNLMRQKMAEQKPPEFNQNYGTPTPNWKILNPLKMRHKINQSNPLHVRWGL